MPLEKMEYESSREAAERPLERGRGAALCHGPGESLMTSGEGSGVMSPSAFSAGEDSTEAGDSEPRLFVDHADLRKPSCMVMGAVPACRSASPPPPPLLLLLPSRLGGLRAPDAGVWVAKAARSVSSFRAVDGARTWYRGRARAAGACPGSKGRWALTSVAVSFECAAAGWQASGAFALSERAASSDCPLGADTRLSVDCSGAADGREEEGEEVVDKDDSGPSMVVGVAAGQAQPLSAFTTAV